MNDPAVEDFLRQRGKYAVSDDRRGKVHYASPPDEFSKLTWVYVAGKGYLKPFELYMRQWRKLMATIPSHDMPDSKVLAKIMHKRITPSKLKIIVDDRCRSGRNPNRRNRVAEPWRREAKKDWRLLKKVIHENAEQLDIDAEMPAETPVIHADTHDKQHPLPGRASTPANGSDTKSEDNSHGGPRPVSYTHLTLPTTPYV